MDRYGGEPDLVIDHDVDRAACAVADELRHGQRFIHDALPRECGVTMQQHAHVAAALVGVVIILRRAHLADHDRVHRLKMRGLGWSEICTGVPPISTSVEVPRWYFTSPEPCTSSGLKDTPANSPKMAV